MYTIGVVALIAGILDPMEGSVVITAGSALIALSTFLLNDRHRKSFFALFLSIFIGVFFLFFFSSLGGFGFPESISWWWAILILPYPIGWLMTIFLLILRASKKSKKI